MSDKRLTYEEVNEQGVPVLDSRRNLYYEPIVPEDFVIAKFENVVEGYSLLLYAHTDENDKETGKYMLRYSHGSSRVEFCQFETYEHAAISFAEFCTSYTKRLNYYFS